MKTDDTVLGPSVQATRPWQAKSTKKRISILDESWAVLNAAPDKNGEIYERSITDFYTGLRETWERLVERCS